MKMSESKDNYIWLRNICKEFKITLPKAVRIDWSNMSAEEIEDIIVQKPYGAHITRGIIKSGIKENRCELCGQEPTHNGKPLTLQCHHLDGNNTNNKLENLQILCPNCHTQTDTYAKSRKGKIIT
jgi:Zn finger protein HypA/HybF involved in hydrogenase expression